jgi:hypothetical protein
LFCKNSWISLSFILPLQQVAHKSFPFLGNFFMELKSSGAEQTRKC